MVSNSYFMLCSSKLFWLKEWIMHPRINACIKEALRVERLTREEMMQLREEKVKRVVEHAIREVPYYRKWVVQLGKRAEDVRLEDFPVIAKQDIKGHENEFVADGWENRLSWTRTSGSTGEPFRFARSEFDYTYATLWRGMARFGIKPGDKRVLVKGVDENAKVSWRVRLKRKVYGWLNRCIVVDAHFLAKSQANILQELKRIKAYKPAYIHGYAASIYTLAQYADRQGMDLSGLKLKAIVTESEKCHDFQRETMERVFGAPVVENYGCVEFGMIAQPARDGRLCINEDHVCVETTPDGEAIFTNLDEFGFPLIRFKNGDRIKLGGPHKELPYRTIESIDGRVAETILLPGGGALQGYIVMYPISKHMRYIREYQVYQPAIDKLIIRIVEAEPLPESISSQILTEMREITGKGVGIEIQRVETIPLTKRGKRAFVCSEARR